MHRHLKALAQHAEVAIAHVEISDLPVTHLPLKTRPLVRRLARLRRGSRHFDAFGDIYGWRYADHDIDAAIRRWKPDTILTVAQGSLCQNARRASARHGLPLVSIFHDWSPDWRDHPDFLRPALTRAFRNVYRDSRLALCISPNMRAALGAHSDARVLYPVPAMRSAAAAAYASTSREVVYAGVLNGVYQEDLLRLVSYLRSPDTRRVTVAVYGPNPYWTDSPGREFLASPLYRGFRPAADFPAILTEAAALLVIMPFAPRHRRFAELSFPSKLTEYTSFRRPIVVWGPAYSSAARWAKEHRCALLVDDPDPAVLLRALTQLLDDHVRSAELAFLASTQYDTCFYPAHLQHVFETALHDSCSPRSPSAALLI